MKASSWTLAVAVQKAAAAGVEGFVVFEDDDGFFDRVESGATFFKRAPSGSGGVAHTVEVSLDLSSGMAQAPRVRLERD